MADQIAFLLVGSWLIALVLFIIAAALAAMIMAD